MIDNADKEEKSGQYTARSHSPQFVFFWICAKKRYSVVVGSSFLALKAKAFYGRNMLNVRAMQSFVNADRVNVLVPQCAHQCCVLMLNVRCDT